MALVLERVDGFEYGAVASLTAGAGLFNTVTNAAIDNANARTGTYCLKCSPTASAAGSAVMNYATSRSQVIISGWVKIDTMPGAGAWVNVLEVWAGSGVRFIIQMGDAGKFRAANNLSATPAAGTNSTLGTYAAGTYYHIEVREISTPGLVETTEWWLDGVAQTTVTTTGIAVQRTYAAVKFGHDSTALPAASYNIYWDDVVIGSSTVTASGETPYGKADVEMVVPTSDGTHAVGTNAYVYSDNNGTNTTAISNATTVCWSRVDEWPDTPTANAADDYVSITLAAPSSASYVQWNTSGRTLTGTPIGVTGYVAIEAAATTANVITIQLGNSSAGTVQGTNLYSGTVGSTTPIYKKNSYLTDPAAAAYTQSSIDLIMFRYTGTDSNPVHRVKTIGFQVAFPASAGATPNSLVADRSERRRNLHRRIAASYDRW